jgi:hypothetical protein
MMLYSFEILAALVFAWCFWLKKCSLKRFIHLDWFSRMTIIFYFEVVLFLLMNASDLHLQNVPGGFSHFIKAGSFPIRVSLLNYFLWNVKN